MSGTWKSAALGTDTAVFAMIGVVVASPIVLTGAGLAIAGGNTSFVLVLGTLVGGALAGYMRNDSFRSGVSTGVFVGLYLIAFSLLHLFLSFDLSPELFLTGVDYWVNGVPRVEIGDSPQKSVSITAAILARFYYPLFASSILVSPVGGFIGSYISRDK